MLGEPDNRILEDSAGDAFNGPARFRLALLARTAGTRTPWQPGSPCLGERQERATLHMRSATAGRRQQQTGRAAGPL
jgi:hypothetical protein